jgi:hypothetical protein
VLLLARDGGGVLFIYLFALDVLGASDVNPFPWASFVVPPLPGFFLLLLIPIATLCYLLPCLNQEKKEKSEKKDKSEKKEKKDKCVWCCCLVNCLSPTFALQPLSPTRALVALICIHPHPPCTLFNAPAGRTSPRRRRRVRILRFLGSFTPTVGAHPSTFTHPIPLHFTCRGEKGEELVFLTALWTPLAASSLPPPTLLRTRTLAHAHTLNTPTPSRRYLFRGEEGEEVQGGEE